MNEIYQQSDSVVADLFVPNFLKTAFQSDASKRNEKIVILDAPLLFETRVLSYMTVKNALIYCDEQVQLHRLMNRNSFTKEEAESRIKAQMPLSEKLKLANLVIDNNGTLENLEEQVAKFIQQVKEL